MKKSHLTIAICLAFVTNSFCAEAPSPIRYIKHSWCPEDHVEECLRCLNHPWCRRSAYFFNEYIRRNTNDTPEVGALHYLFIPPSDPKRMEALKKQLKRWVQSHSYLNSEHNRKSKGYRLLKDFLKKHELFAQETKEHKKMQHIEDDEFYDYGMQWPCTIL